jgi:hypothetical protein
MVLKVLNAISLKECPNLRLVFYSLLTMLLLLFLLYKITGNPEFTAYLLIAAKNAKEREENV